MADTDKIRLCRMIPHRGHIGAVCIGKACTHMMRDGRCSVSPNPPDHWQGNELVIEVTREQWLRDDFYGDPER